MWTNMMTNCSASICRAIFSSDVRTITGAGVVPVPDAVLLFAVSRANAQIHIEQTPAQIKDPHRLAPAFPPTNTNRRTVLYVTTENILNRLSQS